MKMVEERYRKMEEIAQGIYNSEASKRVKRSGRQRLIYLCPKRAFAIFALRKDQEGLQMLVQESSEDSEIGRIAELRFRSLIPERVRPFRKGEHIASEYEQAHAERFAEQRRNAKRFRRENGLSEAEYKEWLKQTKRPSYIPQAFVDRSGEEMSSWQEGAYARWEG